MNVLDPSTRPYLIRALCEWCGDQGFTPYVVVVVDEKVQVPLEYVKDGQIVLNVGVGAVEALKIDNEWLQFNARFGGMAREIFVPVDHVIAVYARENGEGMAFPGPEAVAGDAQEHAPASEAQPGEPKIQLVPDAADHNPDDEPPEPPKPGPSRHKRATLKRIK